MAKKKIVVETKYTTKGAGDVQKNYNDIGKSANKASAETKDLNNNATAFGGSMPGIAGKVQGLFRAMKAGASTAIMSFRTLKGAIASTGIGLLIIAFASLSAFFTKTERGAEKLKVITAVLGGVMDKLMDVVIHLGEALFKAFSNPLETLKKIGSLIKENIENRIKAGAKIIKAFSKILSGEFSQGFKDLNNATIQATTGVVDLTDKIKKSAEAVAEYAKEVAKTAKEAGILEASQNKLIRAERAFSVESAKANLEREKLLTISKDQTKSDSLRLKSLNEASEIDRKRVEDEVKLAEERFRIIKEQNALAESGSEDLKKQADAEQRVFDLKTSFFRTQQRLISQQSSLENTIQKKKEALIKKQEIAENKKIIQAKKDSDKLLAIEQKRIDLSLELKRDSIEKQIELIERGAEKKRLALQDEGVLTIQIEKDLARQTADEIQKIRDEAEKKKKALKEKDDAKSIVQANKTAKKKAEIEKALGDAILNFASSLSSALGEESKSALLIQKTVALAQIGIDTAKAISSLTASSSANPANAISFGGAGAIQFATGLLTIGSNLAQAYSLLKQPAPQLNSTSSSGGQAPTTTQTAPDLGFQGRTAGAEQFGSQTVIKAFVTESDITTSQTNANNIQQLSQIG